MQFNLVSNLAGVVVPAKFQSYNHVVAYSLQRGLQQAGHDVCLVSDQLKEVPSADHTVVISNYAMTQLRSRVVYREKLRKATRGKLCLWLDSDFNDWDGIFDRILVVNRRSSRRPDLYRYVGWAADPELFSAEQQSRLAVFVDPYMRGFYECKFDGVYDEIQHVVEASGLELYQPVFQYNAGRVSWLQIAEQLRKCSFFVVTQPGYWGLMNIEAASCGALLVVHRCFDKPDTWPSKLNHVVYSSPEELRRILQGPVDVEANRKVALENTWSKVASRVLEALN